MLAAGGAQAREFVAKMVGCDTDEIAITYCGSDAMQLLIISYKNIRAGDAVIYGVDHQSHEQAEVR
jgi:selenocysteine lyase/cysteine desulfurase